MGMGVRSVAFMCSLQFLTSATPPFWKSAKLLQRIGLLKIFNHYQEKGTSQMKPKTKEHREASTAATSMPKSTTPTLQLKISGTLKPCGHPQTFHLESRQD